MLDSEVQSIEAYLSGWESEVQKPFEWPEPSLVLNLKARQGSVPRTIKYLHQQSTLHAEHFRRAHLIKLVYLARFYLTEYTAENPLGLYSAARAILENQAFLAHVCQGLLTVAASPTISLVDKGIAFFALIRRARFQTTSPDKRSTLHQLGLQSRDIEPYRVADCINTTVACDPQRWKWMRDHYKALCDFVHANLSSQTVARGPSRLDTVARLGRGILVTSETVEIGRHEYPSVQSIDIARSSTADRARMSLEGSFESINSLPHTPYSASELQVHTGSDIGFPIFTSSTPRNAPCPCGSGKKYKRCHGTGNK